MQCARISCTRIRLSAVFSTESACSLQLVVALNNAASSDLNEHETPAKESSYMSTRAAKKHWSDALVKMADIVREYITMPRIARKKVTRAAA